MPGAPALGVLVGKDRKRPATPRCPGFVAAWTAVLVAALAAAGPAAGQDGGAGQPGDTPAAGPVPVTITIAVIGFGDFDAKQGSYVLDFYLVMSWDPSKAPANFTAAGFEMANGRATSRELQFDETDPETGHRRLWYRVQASLYSEPRYDNYPFDKQTVEIRVEDKVHTLAQLVYVPDHDGSGLEDGFQAAGWEVGPAKLDVVVHEYSFDDPYSQARMVIPLQRSVLSGVLKVIVPPLAFVAISGVAFFLIGADKIATRFALTGNMAIGAIMFHAGQAGSLPSLSRLIFLDRYMLAIEVFLFVSVGVTAAVALAEMKWKDHERAKRWNMRGAVGALAAGGGAFLLLLLV